MGDRGPVVLHKHGIDAQKAILVGMGCKEVPPNVEGEVAIAYIPEAVVEGGSLDGGRLANYQEMGHNQVFGVAAVDSQVDIGCTEELKKHSADIDEFGEVGDIE